MAKATTTTKAIKAADAIVGHRDAAVGAEITKAGRAASSMLEHCKKAAQLAAAQLNPAQPFAERVAAVVSLYAADFTKAGHNVKALFVDALTLLAAGTEAVTVATGKGEIHTTATEAVKASKNVMKAAATEVRRAHGIGRKAGGGRKPAAKAEAAEQAVGLAADVDKFSAWLDALPDYLTDALYHQRIVGALIEAGYTLTKAAKGRKITGSAAI